jgi:soluble lytic murein transglycosylase
MVALFAAQAAQAKPAVYKFVDARGVVHFSNAPSDSRYKLISLRPKVTGYSRQARKAHKTRLIVPKNHGYDSLIIREARANRMDPALIKAVIAAESNFSPRVTSRAGAQGLMQLMPKTAAELGVKDSFHEAQNVSGGTRYLREMLDRYGDLSQALAAYNAGPKAVDRYRGIPPYPETKAYVKRVLAYYRGYRGDFQQ